MIGLTILIDDETVDRRLYQRVIERSGLVDELLLFSYADEALEYLRSKPDLKVDLIFLDINMPKMDGLELVESLTGENDLPVPKIVMVTTENEQFKIVQALEAGCDDFLMKPFQPDELIGRLRAIMGDDHAMFQMA